MEPKDSQITVLKRVLKNNAEYEPKAELDPEPKQIHVSPPEKYDEGHAFSRQEHSLANANEKLHATQSLDC